MDPFYRAFEERYRGPRKLVKSRLSVYLPFVEPLKKLDEAPEILDLGCGRGEWLELMQHNGFRAKGVDLDEGMLLACRELNLDVSQADALDYLQGLTADSLSVVSAFHVVEHIPFEVLRQLVYEAHRVLKPGGLLILETPNSENLVVGTSSFYLDPTHQKPVPAQLLSFLVEYEDFQRVKTLYLQESSDLATAQQTTLVNVLDGVSPDYSVIAQKKAAEEVCALFDEPFERSYGLRLSELAERYDRQDGEHTQWLKHEWDIARQRIEELSKGTGQLEAEFRSEKEKSENLAAKLNVANDHNSKLQAHIDWLQNEFNQSQAHSQWLQKELEGANSKIHELSHSAHHWWAMADSLTQEYKAFQASRSWRITKPLRIFSLAVNKIIQSILALLERLWQAFKFPFKLMLAGLIRLILKCPRLKARVLARLGKYPRLEAHLWRFASLHSISPEAPVFTAGAGLNFNSAHAEINADLPHLTPRTRRIYQDLKAAIEQQQKENS